MKRHLSFRTRHPVIEILKNSKIAHRGFHNMPMVPENSIAAFKSAIRHGFGAEFDVHLTRDGKLVVMHDESTERTTGFKGIIENMTLEEISELRLEGTDEKVPTFDEVLELFEGKYPLIIELKASQGNHNHLAAAVCKRLDSYKGDFCLESFDPRCVLAIKNMRPNFCRGQLASDFTKNPETCPKNMESMLTNMRLNLATRPDFIAYNFEYKDNKAFQKALKKGCAGAVWTIKTFEDYNKAKAMDCIPIFEQFNPNTGKPNKL